MKQTKEIVALKLENEMDLILAHKRSMKTAEMCGFSLAIQTSFATAVSEIARISLGKKKSKKASLALTIDIITPTKKNLVAIVTLAKEEFDEGTEALIYGRRLVDELIIVPAKGKVSVQLHQKLTMAGLTTEEKIKSFIDFFKKEPPLSAYDEIRKKNIQLIALSDKLKESESDYRKLTETLPLMMFALNNLGKITKSNEWLNNFFGEPANKLTGITWQSLLPPDDLKLALPLWEKAQLEKNTLKMQARLKNKNREEAIWHIINIVPLKDKSGNVTEWAGFFVDIHAQKLVEETLKNNETLKRVQRELLDKNEELQKSNHDLEQFAYIASHDLQEPLRKIRIFADLLKKNIQNEKDAEKYLDKIDSSSRRMTSLIIDVLNYSKISKQDDLFEEVDLEQILSSVKIDFELILEEKQATIKSSELPKVNGIKLQMHQLFYNIISNALKFCTEIPRIEIKNSVLQKSEYEKLGLNKEIKYTKIVIKDNGIGFEQQYADKIFTIFQRLNDKASYAGTGIGLALCKKIVLNHGGIISAQSAPGEGTEITVILPL